MPDQSQSQSSPDQSTEQLLAKLGTQALHQLGPDVLKSMSKLLLDLADHIQNAHETHPDK